MRVADDLLLHDFTVTTPDQIWATDITYLRTWEGWIYLTTAQYLFSRSIVGWAMADHMRTELATNAVRMAVHRRNPDKGLIHHSDRGSQFDSLKFGQLAGANGVARSMGHVGSAYDNAVAETVFATINMELIHRSSWPTKAELRSEVFEFIEGFYNRRR